MPRFLKWTVIGLFDEGDDFVEEGWEVVLDDVPEGFVGDVVVFVG